MYPTTPFTMVNTWVLVTSPSSAPSLERPKSATLACIFFVRRMLLLLMSRWIILGLHPLCKYSSPTTQVTQQSIKMSRFSTQYVNCSQFLLCNSSIWHCFSNIKDITQVSSLRISLAYHMLSLQQCWVEFSTWNQWLAPSSLLKFHNSFSTHQDINSLKLQYENFMFNAHKLGAS